MSVDYTKHILCKTPCKLLGIVLKQGGWKNEPKEEVNDSS